MTQNLIIKNALIYTSNNIQEKSLCVADGKIVFVGNNEELTPYQNTNSKVIDAEKNLVLSSFLDTHIHPPGMALTQLYEIFLTGKNLSDYLTEIKTFAVKHPSVDVIYGRGWTWSYLPDEYADQGPPRKYLDELNINIPIILRAMDGHTLWLNSLALQMNNITKETKCPEGGTIELDANGELWGTLKESAMQLVALPEYTVEQYTKSMLLFQEKMLSFGITGIVCLGSLTMTNILEACANLEKKNLLQLRVCGTLSISPKMDLQEQLTLLDELVEKYNTELIKVTGAKFFTDGVVEGLTCHLLEPYDRSCGRGTNFNGDFLWDEERLATAFYEINKRNLQIHVHSIGDGSTHKVLNALESIQNKLPHKNYRNVITHLQLVASTDIARFKKLNIIASVQPYWHFKAPEWWKKVEYKVLGKRAELEYPLQSFFNHDVIVAASSDYPATLYPLPLLAIEMGVTRNMECGALHGLPDITNIDDQNYLLNKNERASVKNMVNSFTINNAYMMFGEQDFGSIAVGKSADLIMLDKNIFTINPLDIDKTKIIWTMFRGKIIYRGECDDQK